MRKRHLHEKPVEPRVRGATIVGGRVRIDGIALIAKYIDKSERQVRSYYQITVPQHLRLPVFKLSPRAGKNCRLSVWVDELDAWLDRMSQRDLYEDSSDS